jgi:uncharacterized protein (TIGR02246 family)
MKKRVEAGVVAVVLLIVSVFFMTTADADNDPSGPATASQVVPSGSGDALETAVLEVERNWIKAFNTLDFDLMASLYHHTPGTTSFSPNSAILYQGWDAISQGLEKYFDSPQGTFSWTLDDEQVTMLSGDMATILGTHVVIDRPADGQEMTGRHVFTRVVQKIDGKWLIVHEHESHIPRGMTP